MKNNILDGVNKAVGKATQGLSGVAQGIKDTTKGIGESIGEAVPKGKNPVSSDKCPKCGSELNGIVAVCPLCGYEIRNAESSSSVSELSKEIDKLQRKRRVITEAIASKISGRGDPTDEKIASLIRNFVVPNTKQDIFEFMLLASGNIDANVFVGKSEIQGLSETVVKAWESKFQQTFQKAKISFGDDIDFSKIQNVYDNKMKEIEDARPKSIFSAFGRRK